MKILTLLCALTLFVDSGDRVILIKGKVAGDMREWLKIQCHNGREWKDNGFDPSFTNIISDYRPLFRKLPNGSWEIGFVSDLGNGVDVP